DTIMAEIFSEDLVANSENLVEDFQNLYEFKEHYDTIITVGDEQNTKQIYAYSQIFCARSSYFRRVLSDVWASLLIQKYYTFLQQSPIRMLHFITHHERFNEIKEAYLETICKNPSLLFDSDEFLSLKENTLKLILERDNLDMKEKELKKKSEIGNLKITKFTKQLQEAGGKS
ncbi:23772_t:CDS:2, partial [Racocetra persica]